MLILSFDPRREHSSIRPHLAVAVARSDDQGRRLFSAAEGLSLTDASTAASYRDRVVRHSMIRGEPAIGHEQSHANHACIRLNPYRVLTMKQLYASAGKAPRRRVHSPSGIAAIAVCGLPPPRIVIDYRALRKRRCRTYFSFLVLEYCSRRRAQLDTVRYLTSRDQAPQRYQQLARQRHDHCRLARAARPLGPHAIPPRQRTVFLEH